ncbi:hypothetical protein [Solirubrobacter pauli]|uniref:hypothetical protein n=1 Tax=Solirubrobacter pauli TaxID=166793 RepID=UPI000EAD2339|nr:hypothetical protein [Solirubrobacter pauli]
MLPTEDVAPHAAWAADALVTAARSGMRLESPDAWRAHFGALPVPEPTALVLRRGDTRVLLCASEDATTVRPVLVFASDCAPTPPDGVEMPGARVFIQDGVAVVWSLTRLGSVAGALDRARYLATTVTVP